jgi:hypothetical protein
MKSVIRSTLGVVGAIALLSAGFAAVAAEPDQMRADALKDKHLISMHGPVKAAGREMIRNALVNASAGGSLPGIDSVVNFTGSFHVKGFDSKGKVNYNWSYAMIGNPPTSNKPALLRAPVIPVNVDLRDKNGKKRFVGGQPLVSPASPFVMPVMTSPIFRRTNYSSSSTPTQYTDAVQRAEFWSTEGDSWHTDLNSTLGNAQTMKISQDPTCGAKTGHCNYEFALNADGTCCEYVLVDINVFVNLLLPPAAADRSTIVGAAELNGQITNHDMSSFLFPNTYLYFGDTSQCCVLGFHTIDLEAGDAGNGNLPRFFVLDYAAWITPGLFGSSFLDITGLSHELAESFNDPFVVFDGVTNLTPWWLAPNGQCQNDLEVGDVIEGLPDAVFPIKMHGYTYHPQNVALLQWFEYMKTSDALDGAFSYPDESVLPSASPVEKLNCK